MILSDLPLIFLPATQMNDRGRVLEQVWEKSFADGGLIAGSPVRFPQLRREGLVSSLNVAEGEKRVAGPSLIISPMIIEGTERLLISNLNLEGMAGGLEFFRHFHKAHLKVSTALRMNAAFPYVTPSVNLPTNPPAALLTPVTRKTTASSWRPSGSRSTPPGSRRIRPASS